MALDLKASEGLKPDRQEEELGFFREDLTNTPWPLSSVLSPLCLRSLRVPRYFEKVMILAGSLNLL